MRQALSVVATARLAPPTTPLLESYQLFALPGRRGPRQSIPDARLLLARLWDMAWPDGRGVVAASDTGAALTVFTGAACPRDFLPLALGCYAQEDGG